MFLWLVLPSRCERSYDELEAAGDDAFLTHITLLMLNQSHVRRQDDERFLELVIPWSATHVIWIHNHHM